MVDNNNEPNESYWKWAEVGWAVRYPMGKGAVPLYSLWDGKHLSYIEARQTIYAPVYAAAVRITYSYEILKGMVDSGIDVVLRDYDGYDKLNMSLTEVLNNQKLKMGHSFVLKTVLTNDQVSKLFGI